MSKGLNIITLHYITSTLLWNFFWKCKEINIIFFAFFSASLSWKLSAEAFSE